MPCPRGLVAVGLVLGLLPLEPAAAVAGPLPRLAVTIAAGVNEADAVRTLQAIGAPETVIVLPALTAVVGDGGRAEVAGSDGQRPLAAGGHFWVCVRIDLRVPPVTGREREQLIDGQLADLVGRLGLMRAGVEGLVIETDDGGGAAAGELPPSDLIQFTLATLATKARGAHPALMVALAPPMGNAHAAGRSLAYVDALVLPADAAAPPSVDGPASGKTVILRSLPASPGGATSWVEALLGPNAASAEIVWVGAASLPILRGLGASVQSLNRALAGGFEMTAAERAPLAVMVDGRPPSAAVAFVGSQTADVSVLLEAAGTRQSPRTLDLVGPSAARSPLVTCVDAVDGRHLAARPVAGQPPGCTADTEYVLLVARVASSQDRVFESVNVTARAALRVEEIVARWQAAREAERRALDNYSVPVFMSLHFEGGGMTSGVDVALELRQFVDRTGAHDWVQTAFRANGVKLRRGQEFPLPQIEPGKIVTRPLELRVDEKYVYQLQGTDTVDGHVCFVVEIKPGASSEALYSGKVWIDGVTFTQVRLRLEQHDGRGNVASHVETQEFEAVPGPEGRTFTLARSIFAEDSVNIAGRSILVEKRYRFGQYTINASDFAAALAGARAGDDPMFRETDEGLRALRKDDRSGQRVVETIVGKRVRALAAGVMYTGAYSVPVPLAGLSWVDFDFRKTGTQLSALFAGPIFAANLSGPLSKNLRWGLDIALSALPSIYREYSGNAERKDRQVMDFQQMVGGLLNWQATPELVLSTQADLYWDVFRSTSDTDPDYRVPASGVTVDFYGQAKYNRKGFNAAVTGEHARRAGWQEFGYEIGDTDPFRPTWTRYSVEAGQHVFVGKLTRAGLSAGYYGGHHLDRFSRYSPSFLSRPRLNGIPSGVDSFDEVTTLGGYYGFNVMDAAKLEGSYTHAWTRNRTENSGLRQLDGLDFGIGMAGPMGTFVQGSVSVALRGNLERYRTRWGCYLMILKPLKR